ncbi:helix-turn-helix domain-containing protein [Companilactobacillus baiquanensis]|uniref:Helix-turn-helix domain-containing protein n=1 Tax=Companilactobacillus baiquanensis TaxID=2486005 RepID=A0ABW1UV81_9LACO|nr:helix-turn-helix domain-containing protein [Companilactobacillus baiquanensis]
MKSLTLESNLREHVVYNSHTIPLSICVDHFDDYYKREWECHWHEEFEFGVLVSGKLQYTIFNSYNKTQVIELSPGDGIFINSEVLHSANALDKNTILNCFVLPRTLFSSPTFGNFEEQALSPVVNSNRKYLFFQKNNHSNDEIISSINHLCELSDTGITYDLQSLELTFKIWNQLVIKFQSFKDKSGGDKQNEEIIKQLIQFIHENYSKKITAEDMASNAQISRTACFRIFQSAFDKTPNEFLNDYRMSMALSLLKDTSQPLTEISTTCGFQSASYFGKKFKSLFKMTPKQYRSKIQKLPTSDYKTPLT